jgi:hypothetical protein
MLLGFGIESEVWGLLFLKCERIVEKSAISGPVSDAMELEVAFAIASGLLERLVQ